MIDKLIYISGPRQLQNELLAAFLERETGVRCVVDESYSPKTDGHDPDNRMQKLIFLDCLGKDTDACLQALESDQEILANGGCLVALFNVSAGPELEKAALERGVRGFFYREDSPERLLKGVQAILAGELWVSRDILTKSFLENQKGERFKQKAVIKLTQRETEILALVSAGAGNEEIADKLCISPHTVKTHVYNIFKKINVPNRLQAALWAVKNL